MAGASQADRSDLRKFKWDISDETGADLFLTGMTVVWPDGPNGQGQLSKVKLGAAEIARDVRDAVSSTVLPAEKAFEPDQNRRKLKKGETKTLEIEFTTASYYRDQDDFQVQLTVSNGDLVTFN